MAAFQVGNDVVDGSRAQSAAEIANRAFLTTDLPDLIKQEHKTFSKETEPRQRVLRIKPDTMGRNATKT